MKCLARSLCTLALQIQNTPQTNLFQCNKRIQDLTHLGRVEEARHLFDEMTQRDSVSWNSMITGYSQIGRLDEAWSLFNMFSGKNVTTWTTLLSAYANNGFIKEARSVFEAMPERTIVSWNAMISGYVRNGDLRSARKLFDEMPARNIASWNSIITGYRQHGLMREAYGLFYTMGERSLVSWMLMISGYVDISEYREAWDVFRMMHMSGASPDQSIFVVVLSAVTGLDNLELVGHLRTIAIKTGYEGDVVVGTAILSAYTRSGCWSKALKFFETMSERNEYSWTTIITALSQCGRLDDAIALYNRVPKHSAETGTAMMTAYAKKGRIQEARLAFDKIPNPNLVTWNALVSAYTQNGMLEEATDVFFHMPVRNSSSWAAMISGLVQNGQSCEALEFFTELHRSRTVPNQYCFTSALFACANNGAVEIGRQIHSLTIKANCQFNSYVGNGLISMYAKCRNMGDVSQVFSTMKVRDTISWNSLIGGLSENLMVDDARSIFEKMPKRDVISWTAIISAYEQYGDGDTALKLFHDMLTGGVRPNQITFTSLVSACGSLGATKLGEQIHAFIFKLGFDSRLSVCNALITMYFKCGCLDGLRIFEEMPDRDIVTWNAILKGCAQNGLGKEAVQIFEQMEDEGVMPNDKSFTGVLCACSHAGLVDKGWAFFNSMSQKYGTTPTVYHYTCMVDLLGRAGQLYEAKALIENMSAEPDSVIWEALLGACRIHRNIKLGHMVAERLFEIGTQNPGTYVLLSNIYASQGMWGKVGEIRKLMKDRRVTKEPGISWIQIKNQLHCFRMADRTHNQIEEIHSTLKEFYERFKATGYEPDTNFVLHDVEEEQKQNELLYHSEKLAIAYGILSTPKGAPIQIMKNLRICGDCHSFLKFMSKDTHRKIAIRDGLRFHHFRDGACSCGDYW